MVFSTVAISVIRIKFLDLKEDVTWQHVESSGWSLGELASALTCSSLPTLRPFVAKYVPSLGLTWTGDRPSYYGNAAGGIGSDPESKAVSRGLRTKKSGTTRGSADSVDTVEQELRAIDARRHSTDDNLCKYNPWHFHPCGSFSGMCG